MSRDEILGQYIQGRSGLDWTWLVVLPCPGDADAAAPRPPSTRARTTIPRIAQARTAPVEGIR